MERLPRCPTCERTALAVHKCWFCKKLGCSKCWGAANDACPSCDGDRFELIAQPFDIGESRLVTWLTFTKDGNYTPFIVLGHIVKTMELVDRREVKAGAALIVGGLSFAALYYDLPKLKLAAAACGMALPAIYLLCLGLKKPAARLLSRAMDYRGSKLAKLHDAGHFRMPVEQAEKVIFYDRKE